MKRFLPIGYTTVCCSYVEREHQLGPKTMIYCSCRHVREVKREWETLHDKNGQRWSAGPGALVNTVTEA